MGKRGGRTPGTMKPGSTWRSGETQTIRVPKKLVPQILKFARFLDAGLNPIECKIIEFLLLKQKQFRRIKKHFDRSTPLWAVFNEFERWLKSDLSK